MTRYAYTATVLDVTDGDTLKLSFQLLKLPRFKDRDLGLHLYIERGYLCLHESVRLLGINAAEHGTTAGNEATLFLRSLLPAGTAVRVTTEKDKTEKYGRWLANVWTNGRSTGPSISDTMLANGHAVAWDGKGQRPTAGVT